MGIVYNFRDCVIKFENEHLPPINLTIEEGEKIAIIVSRDFYDLALLHFLFFINRDYEGYALFKETQFRDIPQEKISEILKKQIHASLHLPLINNLKLIENVYLPLLYHTNISEEILFKKAYEILKKFGIENSFNKLPAFLNTYEKKCGLLARVFMTDADIVYYSHFLDDTKKEQRDFYLNEILKFHNNKKQRITIMTFRQRIHIPEDFKFDKIISLK